MVYLTTLSFIASILYSYVGLNTIKYNKKSKLFRAFFLMTLSMSIWSFAGGFTYLAGNVEEYSFWNKISAFGWCTFEAFALYFVMVLTQNKYVGNLYFKVLIMLPAAISLFMVLFLFGPHINTPPAIEKFFYTGNFLYNFSYLAISIFIIFLWGHKSDSKIQKKQAKIIAVFCAVPFLLNLIFQVILPYLGIITLPNMGQLFALIMLWGIHYSITKYQFLSIPSSLITNELFKELTGMAVLADTNGNIIKANRQICTFLNYDENKIVGVNIKDIIDHEGICMTVKNCEHLNNPVRFSDVTVSFKSGQAIPFKITVIPLHPIPKMTTGLLIIGENKMIEEILKQKNESISELNKELMAVNEILKNKSIRDGLTNFYNHQYINELLEIKLAEAAETKEDLCVLMMDIDNFKRVNDRFGHLAGDRVIIEVANLIRKSIRSNDYVGRYGGEEFIAVLPYTSLEYASQIAERIRLSIQNHDFGIMGLRVTISIGAAQFDDRLPDSLINMADMLLYQAKYNGRNRVENMLAETRV